MNYKFPEIEHIGQIKHAIAGRDEFVVAEREFGTVVNYLVVFPDTFPEVQSVKDALRRECRGLIFDTKGKIMARRFHKFFNMNERPETSVDVVNFDKPHKILEKLDGSMITPILIRDTTDYKHNIRLATKMGINDISMQAEEFVANKKAYMELMQYCFDVGETPIFEWCSNKNRIVLPYEQDRLVLTAIRNNITGDYLPYEKLKYLGNGVEVVRMYDGNAKNIADLQAETKNMEGVEGWIIRFDDGHMLKVKGDWYLNIHKVKSYLENEKDVVKLILSSQIDDAKAALPLEMRQKLQEFENGLCLGIEHTASDWHKAWLAMKKMHADKKSFALGAAPMIDPIVRGVFFRAYGEGKVDRGFMIDQIRQIILNNTNSGPKLDRVRHLWDKGGIRWDYHRADE